MQETIKEFYDVLKLYSDEFYNDLLAYDFAVKTMLVTFGIVAVGVILYYLIDRVNTAKLWIWLLFLFCTALLTGFFAYVLANNALVEVYENANQIAPDYGLDYFFFASTNFLLAVFLFFGLSIPAKFFSVNSRLVPF